MKKLKIKILVGLIPFILFAIVSLWNFQTAPTAQQAREVVVGQELAEEPTEKLPEESPIVKEPEQGKPVLSEEGFYSVLHIYDGDTFSVKKEGATQRVRLIGIDTPETNDKYRSRECFGKEATNRAIAVLGGKKVRLEADPTQANEDKYDRLLRYAFLEDGTFFNELMIREGFAKEYTFKGSAYKHQTAFKEAQEKAKDEKLGMWGSCN